MLKNEKTHLSLICGLLPVDPVSGTWQECKWGKENWYFYLSTYYAKNETEPESDFLPDYVKDAFRFLRLKD
ncbi:hypothetical protein BIY24_05420 [Halobacteriovorax marinus]|uniref:hypothetical protein n=1 Tax=Halobacteriovorax marinus TaxID=97084 RepID=UPI000BC31134|nr:hypothetical protein [Halobacteriovorax marinus]ATH07397.1 hypothetical protein BIY24_05420 [Halobacteriovorax marinus]